jgi:hypothetical protein
VQSVPGEEEEETFKREIKGGGRRSFLFLCIHARYSFFQSRSCELKGEQKLFFPFFGWAIIMWLLDEGEN